MQSADITQIFVALISTIGAILCARAGRREERENNSLPAASRRLNVWIWGMYICIILLAGNLGLFTWRIFSPGAASELRITYPMDGTVVEKTEIIKGTSQNIPGSSAIWVVLYIPEVGRYYPQNRAAEVLEDGHWSSIAYIGQDNDTGLKFDVIAVLADKDARDAFEAYLEAARDKVDYQGLASLPEGAVMYDRATVTRK